MKIAMLQMCSGIEPAANGDMMAAAIAEAAGKGAAMLFTPEMCSLVDSDRERSARHITTEAQDAVLQRLRVAAQEHRIWLHLGSLAVDAGNGRRANRGFVIDDAGQIRARYDKVHLFDVDLPTGESWRESSVYVAGQRTALADTPIGRLGLSVCYDVRFPALYQALSSAGATVLSIPAAFTVPTGQAHWHILLRARAIENAAFVVAAAQSGTHEDGRKTFGHSLVIDPWGTVLLDMGVENGLGYADIDMGQIDAVRQRIPVIAHRRPFESEA